MSLDGFDIMFGFVFILVVGMLIYTLIQGILAWNRNNHSPRLSVNATVVSKKVDSVQNTIPNAGDASGAHGFYTTTTMQYYVCFQVESGDRMEFPVSGKQYDMLAEGDLGTLQFQGTRYLNFIINN